MIKKTEEDKPETSHSILASIEASELGTEGALKAAGIYYISGDIEAGSLKDIQNDILLKSFLYPKTFKDDIQLIINSGGGNLDEAFGLMDLISNIPMDIRTVGLGTCASAAAMLLAAGTKGKRIVGKHSTIMIHRYSWGMADKHQELVARRNIEDAIHEKMITFWLEHSKFKSRKDVEEKLLKVVDNWLTAEEAVEAGIVDKIGDTIR